MDDTDAARHQVADYLGDWVPPPLPQAAPDFVVAADGSGTHRTLQAALDAVPAQGRRHVIELRPGTYREQVCAQGKAPLTIVGRGGAERTVVVFGRYNAERAAPNPCEPAAATPGTAGSASVALVGDDLQLAGFTIANDAMEGVRDGVGYPPGAGESGGAQAVALMLRGDRIQLDGMRLVGHQDTLYVRDGRMLVQHSVVSGDVDFIFGNATLVLTHSRIVSRAGRRTPGNGGHVLAPSTAAAQRLGFLVTHSDFVAEPGVRAGSISLGRAWDHGVPHGQWQAGVSPNGQALVRESVLGTHLGPWGRSTSRRPFDPATHRLLEHRNLADVSREVAADDDGWGGGTRGGADAQLADVLDVRSRHALVAALAPQAAPGRPRIVRVFGRIDLASDDAGRPLGAEAWRDPGFDWAAYTRAYDPATWGRRAPAGPLEEARRRSARAQAAHTTLRVPSRTTLVGIGPGAALVHGMLLLEGVDDVIVRHLHFADARDHFPAWDPGDNQGGEWNADYDNLSLRRATRVWIDHCSFDGGADTGAAPQRFGRPLVQHDGLLDITQQSDRITVSWNVFRQHDKTMLIGSGDGVAADSGRLRVTLHHNLWQGLRERMPRVRHGQVHLYNNLVVARHDGPHAYAYAIGVGHASRIVSEHNVFEGLAGRPALRVLGGDRFVDHGSWIDGQPADLAAPFPALQRDVGWQPAGRRPDPAETADAVAARVRAGAGPR